MDDIRAGLRQLAAEYRDRPLVAISALYRVGLPALKPEGPHTRLWDRDGPAAQLLREAMSSPVPLASYSEVDTALEGQP